MKETERKNIYLKAYCHSNLGDDLFVRIICERYPDTHFFVSARYDFFHGLEDISNLTRIRPEGIEGKANLLYYRLTGLTLSEERILKDCDAAVLLGGSMFIQNDNWKTQLKSNRRLAEKAKNFYVVGANFGPYQEEVFLKSYHELFSLADGVCFRDRDSFELFQDIPSVRMAADVVFQLNCRNCIEKTETMAVIPVDLSNRRKLAQYHETYINSTASVCREALRKGIGVNLISFCRDQGDEKAIEEILSRMSADDRSRVKTVFYKDNYKEITDCISQSRYVLATRFHGMILGFLYGCRTVSVVYDIKTENYLKDMGFSGKIIYPETVEHLSLDDITATPLTDIREHIVNSAEQFADLDGFLDR